MPFQQYQVDGKGFDIKRTDQAAASTNYTHGRNPFRTAPHCAVLPQVAGIREKDGRVEEWRITNTQNMNHPFHIHVNPFQVKEVRSDFHAYVNATTNKTCAAGSAQALAIAAAVKEGECVESEESKEYRRAMLVDQLDPPNQWHDTIIIPAYGSVRIWQRFATEDVTPEVDKNGVATAFIGKTVFHCHFLAHEDTGMISTLFLTNDTAKLEATLDANGYVMSPSSPPPQTHGPQEQSSNLDDNLGPVIALACVCGVLLIAVVAVVGRVVYSGGFKPLPIAEPAGSAGASPGMESADGGDASAVSL